MKKTTKLISIVLALMLVACSFAVMPFAANAAETAKLSASDTATDDTATNDAVVDHIELIKLPDQTEYIQGYNPISGGSSLSIDGLEYNVYYTDGRCENGEIYDVEKSFFTLDGEEVESFDDLPLGKNTVKLAYCVYNENSDTYDYIEFAEYEINIVAVSSIEIIKIPDKVFTAEFPNNDYWDKYMENHTMDQFNDLSIAANMKGAQMQVTFNDGTVIVHTFDKPIYVFKSYLGTYNACYVLEDGKQFLVTDLGGYKAQVEFAGKTTVFEAKHTGSDNNGNNTTPTNPTDTPNGNLTTPTSSQVSSPDTATTDTVTNGSSGTSDSGNGTIATGNNMCSLAAIIILVCAGGVMVFFNRKRYFKH